MKWLRRARDMRAQLFDLSADELIDYSRIFLAAVALFTCLIDPSQPYENGELARALLLGYLIYSIIILFLAKVSPTRGVWPLSTHVIDLGASSLLMLWTEGSSSPFFIFFSFTLIAAMLRWNWRGALWTTVALLGLFIALVVVGFNQHETSRMLMRGSYLLVFGTLLTYFGAVRLYNRERVIKIAAWPAIGTTADINATLEALLGHAADVMGAQRVLVVWTKPQTSERHASLWCEGSLECESEVEEPGDQLVAPCLVDVSFMVRSADSTLVTTHEGLKFCSSAAVAECLRTRYKFKRAITAPFTRSSCRGRVFALDSMCLAHSQLSMVEIVADRVGLELEHHSLQQQAELAAVERERSNLAHNLHDGILQSLTAATLQLKVCRTKAPGRIRQNLGSLQKLLEAEQKRVRNFVNGQRDKIDVHNDDKCSLASASEGVLIEVGAYWCCETPLSVVPADATVPSAFTEHLWLILAEAVANAARHGQASRVIVDLERTTEALAISVSDNGKGFSGLAGTYTDEELTAEHVGPHFLCDRVRTLQGKLMLSTSSAGSRLQIRLPLH